MRGLSNRLGIDAPGGAGPIRARMTIALPVLTTSRIGTLLTCPARHEWAYERGVRPVKSSDVLAYGSAYHACLHALNEGRELPTLTLDDTTAESVACLVAGWRERWPAYHKVLCAERTWEYRPKRARYSIAGKIDAIVEDADGRVLLVEYKTASEDLSPGSDYWLRLLIDRQVSMYYVGAAALGFTLDGVLYDAARRPGIRPRLLSRKKDNDGERESPAQFGERLMADIRERPEWYYRRQEISRMASDIDETLEEINDVAAIMGNMRRLGRWPRNTDSCRRWGRCPYFGPCSARHNVDVDGIPAGYRVAENIHEELADDDAAKTD